MARREHETSQRHACWSLKTLHWVLGSKGASVECQTGCLLDIAVELLQSDYVSERAGVGPATLCGLTHLFPNVLLFTFILYLRDRFLLSSPSHFIFFTLSNNSSRPCSIFPKTRIEEFYRTILSIVQYSPSMEVLISRAPATTSFE